MKVVLFCGGMGTRLGGETNNVPKPMVKIGYRPILWHIMKYYAHYGHKDFILCLGYKADVIKDYFLNYNEFISCDFTLSKGRKKLLDKDSDISDWNITFVDTGLKANIGQRLLAIKSHLENDDMFLANYADVLTDLNMNDMIKNFERSRKIASFICVKPSLTFHVVNFEKNDILKSIKNVRETNIIINGGYFVFRKEIFNYIKEGEELVVEPFDRLIKEGKIFGYKYDKFWHCMDTFKEQQQLTDMLNNENAVWQVWNKD